MTDGRCYREFQEKRISDEKAKKHQILTTKSNSMMKAPMCTDMVVSTHFWRHSSLNAAD